MPEIIGSSPATARSFSLLHSQAGGRRRTAAQIIGIQEGIPIHEDVAGARGNPHEFEGLANIGARAAQHGAAYAPAPSRATRPRRPQFCITGIPRQASTLPIACAAFSGSGANGTMSHNDAKSDVAAKAKLLVVLR